MTTRSALFATLVLMIATTTGALLAPVEAAVDTEEYILEFDPSQVSITERDGQHVVSYPRAYNLGEAGNPALPTKPIQFEIPEDRTVSSVSVQVLRTESIGRNLDVAPITIDHRQGTEAPHTTPNPAIYGSDAAFPRELASFTNRGGWRGHTVATVNVTPWIYTPATGNLELVTRLRVRVELEAAESIVIERFRVDPVIEARFEETANRLLLGGVESLVVESAQRQGGDGPARPGPYQPTFSPTTDGSAVEYVIVTNEELEAEFQRLADWKTQKGVQAVVRTVEWIDMTYPNGVDRAERVRFFLADAYQNWGAAWVLLGGDTDVVPFRYAFTTLLDSEEIPADYYFMCLDANWNLDGDHLFGEGQVVQNEVTDGADLFPEVLAGRAPVSTVAEAQAFVDKNLAYAQTPGTGNGYTGSVLFLAERLFAARDGAEVAEEASALLPPWIKQVKLYEEFQDWPGSLPLDHDTAVDSINNGFGMVHHVGHGFRNTMSVGDQSLTNGDADGFNNQERQSFVFGINCSSASIDFNSIGERFVKNPNGGAIAYYGTSRFAFVNTSESVQEEWFNQVYQDSMINLGTACTLARIPFIGQSIFDNQFRWTLMALTLLGDPELEFYINNVAPLQVAHAANHELGSGLLDVTVTSSGSPVEGAPVVLWRDGEIFLRATTNSSGVAALDIAAGSAGDATITVKHKYYAVGQSVVTLTSPTGAYPVVQSVIIDDNNVGASSGDSDGRTDAGETVELAVTLQNTGAQSATGVSATLTVDDPGGHMTITGDTVSYGTIGAGSASQGSSKFVVDAGVETPEGYQPTFTVTTTADQGTFSDVFVLPVRRAFLEHFAHIVDDAAPRGNDDGVADAGEEIWYTIDLRNTGQETSFSLDATLSVVRVSDMAPEPLVTVTDGAMSFGDIDVGQSVTGDRFEFTIDGSLVPADLLLEVTYDDIYGQGWVEHLDLINPGVVDSVRAFGTEHSITLNWKIPEDEDILGYDIYQGDAPGGPFVKVNDFVAEGSAVFEQLDLPPLTRFYYQIVTRDHSFNQGPPSAVISGTTNPPLAEGWPITISQSASSSVQIADIDGDWNWEIFSASDYQYGWNADGSELVDGDDDPRTAGVISPLGFDPEKGFGATAAIGDVDNNGDAEICNIAWSVFEIYLWDSAGQIMPGWPKPILSDFNWSSPVLADLDNDGDLEIVVWTAQGGRLFAWHHDGTEVADGDNNPGTDGILRREFGIIFNFSSPAIGNLDADPELEIVFCSNLNSTVDDPRGGVWVINHDGTDVPGWPVFTGNPTAHSNITASPAIVNIDGVGGNEVLITSERDGGLVHLFNSDGTDFPGWPVAVPSTVSQTRTSSPVPGDIDGDGNLDIIYPDSDGDLWVWDQAGNVLPGFPINYLTGVNEPSQSTPSIGDIDDDGMLEILFGDESGKLHAINHDGTPVEGFPIQMNGELRSTPVIWDVDNDSLVEILATNWDQNVYVWDLPFEWHPERTPWPVFRHDQWNTGDFGGPIQIAVADPLGAPTAVTAMVHPPFPNPFNPRTRFQFDVAGDAASRVEIAIYDVSGRMVRRLINGLVDPGQHSVEWDGRTMSGGVATTGVYLYRASVGAFETTGKLTMLK